jgi:hypothetical protein
MLAPHFSVAQQWVTTHCICSFHPIDSTGGESLGNGIAFSGNYRGAALRSPRLRNDQTLNCLLSNQSQFEP